METLGPKVERDPMFPEGVNVGFAEIRGPNQIRLRVWERGAGLTKACGTGACAAVVAAHRQKRTERSVEVLVDGGSLEIEWRAGCDFLKGLIEASQSRSIGQPGKAARPCFDGRLVCSR